MDALIFSSYILSIFLAVIVTRIVTANEWRKHCQLNDERWRNYFWRLSEKDANQVEEKHLE